MLENLFVRIIGIEGGVMADKSSRREDNAKGKYFVDGNCIAAKFCVNVASKNFRMSTTGYAYVYKQPDSPEEESQASEAVIGCPVNAVGTDGKDSLIE